MPMTVDEIEKKRKSGEKKFRALQKKLKKENPQVWNRLDNLIHEMEELWKDSPFVGEEESYGRPLGFIKIREQQQISYSPLTLMFLYTLLKQTPDRFDRELKWLKKNKQILEMMVKEYLAQIEHK